MTSKVEAVDDALALRLQRLCRPSAKWGPRPMDSRSRPMNHAISVSIFAAIYRLNEFCEAIPSGGREPV